MESKTVQTRHAPIRYLEGGSGEPLVFLHGAGGMTPDDPLLKELTSRFHVYAPFIPGYGETEECGTLRDMLDFALHGWDVVEALGLKNPILVGHSMGGMIAAEMAALAPNDVSRLALICPAGLWLDDHPIVDMFSLLPFEMPGYLFHDPAAGAAMMTAGLNFEDPKFLQDYLIRNARQLGMAGAAMMTAGMNFDDPKFLQDYLIRNARQLGMAGKLLFPIPERGLAERLYRVKAKTVIVWGESDKLIPPIYGPAFQSAIAGSKLVNVPEAGHMIIAEQPAAVLKAVEAVA